MEGISTGQLIPCLRTEVVQTLTSLIMMHTMYPSSEQYNVICMKLIEQYPNLKDDIGTGYVSFIISTNYTP